LASKQRSSDPLRPADHVDSGPAERKNIITQPKLDFVGYLRFFWRQLTSMRTALFLLLLLAVAAIPGSLVPQVSSDPNGVIAFRRDNPDAAAILDVFQVFTTYSSVWFSAIYLLLFISLIGCVIPRTKHHLDALRSRPPKTPARLARLEGFTAQTTHADATTVVDAASELLRKQGYRVERYSSTGAGAALGSGEMATSVSAERGYLRETGNLVFHIALIGVLIAVGIGGGFGYQGQKVISEGKAFANVLANYDSFNPGRFFSETQLVPFSIQLDTFEVDYVETGSSLGMPKDFRANVVTTMRGEQAQPAQIRVNEPLPIGETQVYLLGNGYAPVVTVRDAEGAVVFSQPVLFRPVDANLTSLGVIKVPDGLEQQLGMLGFFYPSAVTLESGALTSNFPDLINPVMTLELYVGDLGLDDGASVDAYSLDTDALTEIAGRATEGSPTLRLQPGDTIDLPDGLGSIALGEIPRFAALDVHSDPSQGWVLLFSMLVVAGLVTGLFVPRRRVWVKAVTDHDGSVTIEYAGLARGDDPTLVAAVADLAQKLGARLDSSDKA
jgi:cytochrome c biogenesis protein